MKITGYELARLKIPLKTPFRTSLRTVNQMDDVVIIIETNTGQRGYGSAPATKAITGDTHESIIEAIRLFILPAIRGKEIHDLNRITDLIQTSITGNTSAKAAAEVAVYDLFAQSQGEPLYQVLGGGDPFLSTDITISVDEPENMVHEARVAVKSGFKALKVKVGTDMNQDIKRVTAIFAAVGDKATIGLDANQGWSPRETVNALRELESEGIELQFVEQPVKGSDLEGMRYVTERVSTPVVADESAFGPREVIKLIQVRGADIINIKLMKSGGISRAIRMADIASTYDMSCMMGCMLETGIGVSAAAHVAVAKSDVITLIDLDAPLLATMNPLSGGACFDGAEISISDAPGLGIDGIDGLSMLEPEIAAAS